MMHIMYIYIPYFIPIHNWNLKFILFFLSSWDPVKRPVHHSMKIPRTSNSSSTTVGLPDGEGLDLKLLDLDLEGKSFLTKQQTIWWFFLGISWELTDI